MRYEPFRLAERVMGRGSLQYIKNPKMPFHMVSPTGVPSEVPKETVMLSAFRWKTFPSSSKP